MYGLPAPTKIKSNVEIKMAEGDHDDQRLS